MSKKEKTNLIRILACLAAFLAVFIADKVRGLDGVIGGEYGWLLPFALYLAVYLAIGYDVLWRALRNISAGRCWTKTS